LDFYFYWVHVDDFHVDDLDGLIGSVISPPSSFYHPIISKIVLLEIMARACCTRYNDTEGEFYMTSKKLRGSHPHSVKNHKHFLVIVGK
jgi:hypothetical protein